jgi:hypothetical protein
LIWRELFWKAELYRLKVGLYNIWIFEISENAAVYRGRFRCKTLLLKKKRNQSQNLPSRGTSLTYSADCRGMFNGDGGKKEKEVGTGE